MNKALVSIGSNEGRETNVSLCRDILHQHFSHISFSKTAITKPYGDIYKNDFLNQLAFIYTEKSKDEVCEILKSIEKEIGRKPTDKYDGNVVIDIDLIIWNNEVVKPEDMNRSYINDLMPVNYFSDNLTQPKD